MRRRSALFIAALAAVLLPPIVAAAQSGSTASSPRNAPREIPSPITDRFALRATYFVPSIDTEVRLDTDIGIPGTLLVAEEDLGFDDSENQGRIELLFRLRERGRVRVDYFKLTRSGDVVLDEPIIFGNDVYLLGDRVLSSLDWRTLNFTLLGSLLKRERFEIGAGLGFSLLEAKARARVPSRSIGEEASAAGAAPLLALDGTWRFTERFSLNVRGQYLGVSVDELDGSIADYHADVQYRWRRNLSAGLGYTILKTKLDVADEDFPGRFALDASGPEAFIRISF